MYQTLTFANCAITTECPCTAVEIKCHIGQCLSNNA